MYLKFLVWVVPTNSNSGVVEGDNGRDNVSTNIIFSLPPGAVAADSEHRHRGGRKGSKRKSFELHSS
jgi:hypothetical protein